MIFIQGCSTTGDDLGLSDRDTAEINLPKESEEYGKAVAREVRAIAQNFNNKNIDYTQAHRSPKIKRQVIKELYKDISEVVETTSSTVEVSFEDNVPQQNLDILTKAQLDLLNAILNAYRDSKSNDDLFKNIRVLNKEIYKLPEIERERLFNLTATLYYGLKEINELQHQGLMIPIGMKSASVPRLKSFQENGEGGIGGTGSCKQVESLTSIAVGSEIFVEGLKHVVKQTTYAAARALWVVTACLLLSGDTDYNAKCGKNRDDCIANPWKNGIRLDCRSCYDHCMNNRGMWRCPVYE